MAHPDGRRSRRHATDRISTTWNANLNTIARQTPKRAGYAHSIAEGNKVLIDTELPKAPSFQNLKQQVAQQLTLIE